MIKCPQNGIIQVEKKELKLKTVNENSVDIEDVLLLLLYPPPPPLFFKPRQKLSHLFICISQP